VTVIPSPRRPYPAPTPGPTAAPTPLALLASGTVLKLNGTTSASIRSQTSSRFFNMGLNASSPSTAEEEEEEEEEEDEEGPGSPPGTVYAKYSEPAWRSEVNWTRAAPVSLGNGFSGPGFVGYLPSDANIAVGPNHFIVV
jgi:hypothetical protein